MLGQTRPVHTGRPVPPHHSQLMVRRMSRTEGHERRPEIIRSPCGNPVGGTRKFARRARVGYLLGRVAASILRAARSMPTISANCCVSKSETPVALRSTIAMGGTQRRPLRELGPGFGISTRGRNHRSPLWPHARECRRLGLNACKTNSTQHGSAKTLVHTVSGNQTMRQVTCRSLALPV